MHPFYEYMVGDTVSNVVQPSKPRQFAVARKKFIIKECRQVFIIGSGAVNEMDNLENNYKGFIKNLGNYLFDEHELCTCRMMLTEKTLEVFREWC